MKFDQLRGGAFAAMIIALALAAGPAAGAGFSIFEQGSKAMGTGGAFTAVADDGSAMFHNAAGLAFQENSLSAGATFITFGEAEFQGGPPFPGSGSTGEQKSMVETPPHAYWVHRLGDRGVFGLGLNSPFGLTTEWDHPENFAGRYLSTRAALRVIDLNPTYAFRISDTMSVGLGAIVRYSDVELERFVGQVNPFTLKVADVGRVEIGSDFATGYGFNLGFLHRWNNSFSWGFSYRSKVKLDYEGDARFTQILTGNAQFDAIIRSRIPFGTDLPVETSIDFPDEASLGLAFMLTPRLQLLTDFNWTGWSSFDEVVLDFTTANAFDSTIPEAWDDVTNYRIGFRWMLSPANEWRFGYVIDNTPQPEDKVSPLLPDANRTGLTIGFGHKGRLNTDLALMYLPFDERERNETAAGESVFHGTYNTTAWLLGATISF